MVDFGYGLVSLPPQSQSPQEVDGSIDLKSGVLDGLKEDVPMKFRFPRIS